jgi:hypothetical protein
MAKAAKPFSLTSLREKLIKGREGRQRWPLRYIPSGRGRGIAADVRRNPVADHRDAGAGRTGVDREMDEYDQRRCARYALIKAEHRQRDRLSASDRLILMCTWCVIVVAK